MESRTAEITNDIITGREAHRADQKAEEGPATFRCCRVFAAPPGKRLSALRAKRVQLQDILAAICRNLTDVQEERAAGMDSLTKLSYLVDQLIEEVGQGCHPEH